ncbi:MAG: hypothetical protein ACI4HI_07450 [Lachnospiraceae bacterium]
MGKEIRVRVVLGKTAKTDVRNREDRMYHWKLRAGELSNDNAQDCRKG